MGLCVGADMSMKWEKTPFKSDLARARGLGSAQSGTEHWIAQRLTAIASLILLVWAVSSLVCLIGTGTDYGSVVEWITHPVRATLLILLVVATFYHAVLGAQVVVEDYIHNEALKIAKLWSQKLFFIAIGFASIFSILKIAL